ncbi:tail fiber protein [Pedobacter gandavensis]|uniref:phage tail protein n=1 Tax=Pedobacter gandavensis TaxID=2679963 RepID=UPI0024798E08|nr:tail fiber protein [Pedobacter gandavensis]WGQ11287.1 tail fiber protein [Pedobacter gandavensis]
MIDPYLGEITMFAGQFAPRGWHICDGALLSISQNQALFALLGTTYGGNGQTNFGLPNLLGRAPMHSSANHPLGTTGGKRSIQLSINEIPTHNHAITGSINLKTRGDAPGNFSNPDSHYIAQSTAKKFFGRTPSSEKMAPLESNNVIGAVGSNTRHENMQPYLAVNFIIATVGVFPSRN